MKRNIHTLLAVALVLGGWASTPVQATQDGEPKDLGFIIGENFSTSISLNDEPIIDVFKAISFSNENRSFRDILAGIDFAPDLPPDVAINTFVNVREAFEGAGEDISDVGIRLAFNPDPFIAYNITFTNPTDAPAEFIYNFLFPTLPVVGATQVVSQLNVDLIDTDGDGSASITLSQFSPFDDQIQGVGFMEGGIFGSFTDPDIGVGTAITALGETLFAPEISAGPEAATAFDALTVFGQFTLSAGDSVTLTGLGGLVEAGGFLPTLASFDFDNFPSTVIPEPSSALLLLLGLAVGQAGLRNRRV